MSLCSILTLVSSVDVFRTGELVVATRLSMRGDFPSGMERDGATGSLLQDRPRVAQRMGPLSWDGIRTRPHRVTEPREPGKHWPARAGQEQGNKPARAQPARSLPRQGRGP